jgi:toxin CcdB
MDQLVAMAQFDVFVNPIAHARRAYPYVVALQSDFLPQVHDPIVAPLALLELMPAIAGRLAPIVGFNGSRYGVLVPALMGIRARDLVQRRGSIAAARGELLAAIDYLFFGP